MKIALLVVLAALAATSFASENSNVVVSVSVPVGGGITALIQLNGDLELGTTPGAVMYDKNDQIKKVGDSAVSFDSEGRILKMGFVSVIYDEQGRVKKVGSIPVTYDQQGRVSKIGMSSLKYYDDNSVKMISPMDGALIFVGKD